MHIGTTAVYDLQERGASSKADAIRKLIGENERQSTSRYKVYDFRFTGSGPHRGFTQDWLEDLWSAQVVASWITDWEVWEKTFPEQVGLVSAQGFTPSNINPLSPQSNGRVTLDLSNVLDPIYTIGDGIIQGPDGIYGPATDSLFYEYARTGKVFGETIPAVAKPVFDRILNSISTRDILQGLSERAVGQVSPKESADAMEASSVSGDAQINAGMEQTKPSRSLGQTWVTTIIPGATQKTLDPVLLSKMLNNTSFFSNLSDGSFTQFEDTNKTGNDRKTGNDSKTPKRTVQKNTKSAEGTNWLLWGGLSAAVLIGAGAYYYYNKDNSSEV
jgi:hypothetical protein